MWDRGLGDHLHKQGDGELIDGDGQPLKSVCVRKVRKLTYAWAKRFHTSRAEDWDTVLKQVSTIVLLMWTVRDNKDCQPQSPTYLSDAADQNTSYFLLY